MMPVVETADAERASAAARKPADTAASLQDIVMQKVVADTPNALTTAAEASVAAALHADTAAYKHPEEAAAAAGEDGGAADEAAAVSSLPAVAAEGLDAAVEAAEWAPDPVKSQGHFQVSVVLLVCDYRIHREQGL